MQQPKVQQLCYVKFTVGWRSGLAALATGFDLYEGVNFCARAAPCAYGA
jgi:hypothetical protein